MKKLEPSGLDLLDQMLVIINFSETKLNSNNGKRKLCTSLVAMVLEGYIRILNLLVVTRSHSLLLGVWSSKANLCEEGHEPPLLWRPRQDDPASQAWRVPDQVLRHWYSFLSFPGPPIHQEGVSCYWYVYQLCITSSKLLLYLAWNVITLKCCNGYASISIFFTLNSQSLIVDTGEDVECGFDITLSKMSLGHWLEVWWPKHVQM